MLDALCESFRKASESSLQIQQDVVKHWAQQWQATASTATAAAPAEWSRTVQQRWLEVTLDLMNQHREAIDSAYRSGIQIVEQAFRISEAKSSEDYRRMAEDLWRKLFEVFKGQSEIQFRDFQTLAEKSFAAIHQNHTPS
jgi:hypothetical protein